MLFFFMFIKLYSSKLVRSVTSVSVSKKASACVALSKPDVALTQQMTYIGGYFTNSRQPDLVFISSYFVDSKIDNPM